MVFYSRPEGEQKLEGGLFPMPEFVSFRTAVNAYANGATVWLMSAGDVVEGRFWDLPREAFRDPAVRAEASRSIAHSLRNFIRYEDSEVKFFLSW